MKISIVIPAYNEEKYIEECLASVTREVATTECNVEVIVVNNASTDNTRLVALKYPDVKVVDEMQKGIVFARRAGFLASTGELVANVDADTIMPSGWLATVLKEFETHTKIVALSGPFIYYDLSIYRRALTRSFYYAGYVIYLVNHYVLRVSGLLQGGNFIVRRSAMEEIGGFDTSIVFYGEDTDIARRLHKIGHVKFTFKLPMYTSGRRLYKEGICMTGVLYALNFFSVIFLKHPITKKYTDIRLK